MASLRDAVKDNANELRDGIPWVVFWREGRSWHSEAVFFSMDYAADTIDPDDIGRLEHISRTDPRAVALNGYYCGHLGEDMTLDELTSGVRWHYENGFNTLAAFIENHDGRLPPELLEEARQAAHAAGLPFSERPYDGQEFDPYSYDGSMTPEDYELWQQLIAQERSAKMNDPLSIQIHNRQRFEQNEPGEWLKLPATAEQLQEALRRVGITAENRQDFFINGIESPIEAVARLSFENVQAVGIDELNYLAARLEALDPAQIEKLNINSDMLSYWDDVHHLTEYVQNTECFLYIPGVTDHAALGDYYLNKSGLVQMSEGWKAAVNVERLGQLAAEQEKGVFWDNGYMLQTGDEWEPVNEIPQEYRIMSFPQPEPSHDDPIDYDAISTRAPAVATTPAPELAAVPQPVKPIVLESETAADKLKEITDKLEHGIAGIFESEQYADYLKTLSKFHNYSLNNTILIAMQKPDASHVAGFNTWKNEFERNVRKGEKGIKIIAPSPFKVKKEMEKIDPDTQRPVVGADGKPVTEEIEVKIPAYKVVSVFDVSQTEGKELPTIGVDELTGDVEQYRDFFAALEKTSPFSIAFEPIGGDTKGYANYEEKRIAIREGMSELQTLKTAIHEITHARLHDHINTEQEQPRADRRTREVQAESIAYTVCQHYGLDTSDYSFGYVAGWSGGKELAELKASLETIRTTAAGLITEIDGHFAELQKDREHTAEQEPPTPEQADSVFHRLPPEQQQALSDEVKATLQFFIDNDLKEHGELSDGTLEAIAVQGYAYRDGKLEKLAEPQPVQQEPPTEQQPGFEEWSEPATAENAPENPGTPSDDIDAYLTEQDDQPAQAATPTETKATYYTINEQAARRAKEAISYSDYRPGSATAEYRQSVDKAVEMAKHQKARVDPMYHAKIDGLLNTYARKLAENMNNGYSITARVPSILIAGPSNFPVRRKEKQNAASDRNMQEWRDIQGLLDKIRSTGMGGISADDPNAVQKLQAKLAGLEKSQETMKAANAYYRKHKTLDGFPGLSSEQIQKLTASMKNRWYGREATQPFEPYSLQNNNAEINRVKGRIAELTRKRETAFVGWQFEDGKVEANTQDNRLQIFFDGKPDEATRTELKGNGFKWAPSVGAWQRQLNNNAFFAANYVKSIQPLTGEKPTDLQRRERREATAQPVQQEQQAAPEQERQQGDTYAIYQLKQDDSTRDFRFEPYDRLQAAGLTVDPANYVFIYAGQLGKDETLETIFERFNISHPEDFTGHSLSVSDVVTLNRDGKETAHYVDSFGYKEVPEFLNPAPAFDMQQTAAEPPVPDNFLTGEKIKTPRGSFSLTDMTPAQMEAAGYGFHHSSDDGRYHIMGNGTRAFAIINPLRTAEMSTEQNYNMIDGIPNNRPTVDELEKRAKAGEQISLSDLAAAIKTDKAAAAHDTGKKPSIREQLKQTGADLSHKDKSAPSRTRDKNNYLEV
jgi:antirestriction protein ArdC